MACVWVNNVQHGGDLVHDADLPDSAQVVRDLRRETDDVLPADGRHVHARRVLVVVLVGLAILQGGKQEFV